MIRTQITQAARWVLVSLFVATSGVALAQTEEETVPWGAGCMPTPASATRTSGNCGAELVDGRAIAPAGAPAAVKAAIAAAQETDCKETFVIGGGEIYAEAMPIADRIYITRVHVVLEGDTWFPAFSEKEWELSSNLDFPVDEKHAYAYSFQVWERKK